MKRKELLHKLTPNEMAIFVHMRNKLNQGNTLLRMGISIYNQNGIVETGLCTERELSIINERWDNITHPEGVE